MTTDEAIKAYREALKRVDEAEAREDALQAQLSEAVEVCAQLRTAMFRAKAEMIGAIEAGT